MVHRLQSALPLCQPKPCFAGGHGDPQGCSHPFGVAVMLAAWVGTRSREGGGGPGYKQCKRGAQGGTGHAVTQRTRMAWRRQDGTSRAARVAQSLLNTRPQKPQTVGWWRMGTHGEDKAPCSDGTAQGQGRGSEDWTWQQGAGRGHKDTAVTDAFLRRAPRRGLAVLFLCRVLLLQVICFFQVVFPPSPPPPQASPTRLCYK